LFPDAGEAAEVGGPDATLDVNPGDITRVKDADGATGAGDVAAADACARTVCGDVCVDTQTDARHCGACGRGCSVANGDAGCVAGACVAAACNAGFADCDANAANGCEVDVRGDVNNCGRCGQRCAIACAAGACVEVAQIDIGSEHGCMRLSNGTVRCWGGNRSDQIGDGTTINRLVPTPVVGLSNVVEIEVGYAHSCARLNDGTVRCWGLNSSGQLGNGGRAETMTPTEVRGLSGVVEMAAGYQHTCARVANGVRCWGSNYTGAVGNGVFGDGIQPEPVEVVDLVGLPRVVEIVAGYGHTCLRLAEGTVRCWGTNDRGQLGDGTTTRRLRPTPVPTLVGVVGLGAGYEQTCARLDGGAVWCWGANERGQLGDGSTTDRSTPAVIPGLTNVAEISVGYYHGCARLVDNTVRCWGDNGVGQLGDGTVGAPRLMLVTPTGLRDVAEVAAFETHTCARRLDRLVFCWGANRSGQLGDGTTLSRSTPTAVRFTDL
jgi:alpha-tubulin suppressor-like RCC1 family protein